MECIQYTVRGVPTFLDTQLRLYARQKSRSLNAVLLDLLTRGLGLEKECHRNDELLELAGTWVEDPEMEKAFSEMDTIDEDLWR